MPTIAERVRRARSLSNLSQTALADAVGVKRSAVAQWERRDGCLPSMQHIVAIAKATNVQVEWLGTGQGDMRCEAAAWSQGINLEEFAQDDLEAEALAALRKVPLLIRKQMVGFLALIAKNY